MSENWIALIPKNPRYVPEPERQSRAKERFAEIAPDADEIAIKLSDNVEFFDCGANFESICCPSCKEELSMEWWGERMDEDYGEEGFRLEKHPTPCCNAEHTLNELSYAWPQGFARFALDAMNPNIGKLNDDSRIELEAILGAELRVIYQHI